LIVGAVDDSLVIEYLSGMLLLSDWPLALFAIITDYGRNLPTTCYVFGVYRDVFGVTRGSDDNISSCGRYIDGIWDNIPDMSTDRHSCGVSQVGDYIYVIGGIQNNIIFSNVERLHVPTLKWSTVQSLPHPRYSSKCVSLNNIIYCIGGLNDGCGQQGGEVILQYDTIKDIWTTFRPSVADIDQRPFFEALKCWKSADIKTWKSFVVWHNQILGFDGNQSAIYDVNENKWSRFTIPIPAPRYGPRAVLVNDTILLLGGENVSDENGDYNDDNDANVTGDTVDEYQPTTRKCRRLTWTLPTKLDNFAAWFDNKNKLL
jgi:hypothetical protein